MSEVNHYSPEGRIFQVEYAISAASQGDLCLGIVANDGVLLAIDCSTKNVLIDNSDRWNKFFHLSDDIICVASGIMSDANVVIDELRSRADEYESEMHKSISCEFLVSQAAEIKHVYTVHAEKRPFGVSMLYMGWDKEQKNFKLYHTDPEGNYIGWHANAIGRNCTTAQLLLRQALDKHKDGLSLRQAKIMAIEVMWKTLGVNKLKPDMFKIATIQHMSKKVAKSVLCKRELERLIRKYKRLAKAEKKEDVEMEGNSSN